MNKKMTFLLFLLIPTLIACSAIKAGDPFADNMSLTTIDVRIKDIDYNKNEITIKSYKRHKKKELGNYVTIGCKDVVIENGMKYDKRNFELSDLAINDQLTIYIDRFAYTTPTKTQARKIIVMKKEK